MPQPLVMMVLPGGRRRDPTLVLGYAESGLSCGSETIEDLARENYSEEFRCQA